MTKAEIRDKYRSLKAESEEREGRLRKKLMLVSLLRLIVFIAGGVITGFLFSLSTIAGIISLFLSVSVFLFLVKFYLDLSEKIEFLENIIAINASELKALEGDYSSFDGGKEWMDIHHDFSHDIDLFGDDSLFRYLNRTVTGYGREKLAFWLMRPSTDKDNIREIQEAVSEVAPMIDWQQRFRASGLGKPLEKQDIEDMKDWLSEENSFRLPSYLKTLVTIMQVLTVSILILAIVRIAPVNFFTLIFIINLLAVSVFLRFTNSIHSKISKKHGTLLSLSVLAETFRNESFRSRFLANASSRLINGNKSASSEIRKLGKISQAFDHRLNFVAGIILNGLILWDFLCLIRIEKWKNETAELLPQWLNTMGSVDALISLAIHSYNNPDYVFPEFTGGDPFLEGKAMGHPLIDDKSRVCNDFKLEHKGLVCIITGANMAGKSTFLRTVAINMILGMTGTKVCATSFRFVPVNLFTSMRTTDSLSSRESYFYAELKRLKVLKDRMESGEQIFFILDEILKGTNSNDKSTGSKLFLLKLASLNGTGLVATHDISLGEMETEMPGRIMNKCFETDTEGEDIRFDYILRDGITKRMNAALLMKQMGIT